MTSMFAIAAALATPVVPATVDTVAASPVATIADTAVDTSDSPDQKNDVVITGARSEGTRDYSAKDQRAATGLPLSLKDTPQSVSVVTRAQIQDFQLNDVDALLTTVPGVSVLAAETDRVYYSARGFDIQTFQIDGVGLPFAFEIQTGSIDTAIYDRVEVVKGAPGLLSPTGNPSAVIDFVRKRPYRTVKASASAQYGSYDHLRLDGDISVPLTSDGSIRARGVGAYLDTDSYLDRYHLRRWVGYGIVEADLGASTQASLGFSYQDHQSRGAMWGAIPLYYTDGSILPVERGSSSGTNWAGWNVTDRQIFGDLTHDFGGGWQAKLTLMRRATSEDDKLFYVYGHPDATTGDGIFSYPGAFTAETRNFSVDARVTGQFNLGGRSHDVMFGFTRGAQEYKQFSSYDTATIGLPVSIPDLFAGTFPEPNFPTSYTLSLDTHTQRLSGYALIRLNLADPFKFLLGANVTHATSAGTSYGVATDYDRTRFLPYVGATLDLTPSISAYASYTTIFNPQTQVDASNRILDPITGDNIEAGLKGAWFGGKLNASVSLFQTRQNNTAESAGFVGGKTIYVGVDAKSQGIELEVSGEVAPGLQVTSGFSTMRLRNDSNQQARTFVPRTTARLNVAYTPPALQQLTLGTTIQYQSSVYIEPGDLSTTTGKVIRVTQGDYALVGLLARYALTPNLSLSVNVQNLTNAKYLTSLTYDQGYYGAPRTVLGTISLRY